MTNKTENSRVIKAVSLPEYFKKQLYRYADLIKPQPHEDTLWYVGEMMVRFSRSDHFFDYHDGMLQSRPLALLYGDARAASNHRERCLLLQKLGDMALFMGAIFPERHARYGLKLDYFIGMGSAAFDFLAEQSNRNRHIYRELTHSFSTIVELVAAAASRKNKASDQQLLAIYEAWLQTRDPVLARQLKAFGLNIQPVDSH